MKNPALIIPGALEALQALAKAAEKGGVPKRTLELVHLRVSQINGCSVCADMSFPFLHKAGQADKGLGVSLAGRSVSYGRGTRCAGSQRSRDKARRSL